MQGAENLEEVVTQLRSDVAQKDVIIERKDAQIKRFEFEIACLHEKLRLSKHRRFGPSSEAHHPDLFNEAEQLAALPVAEPTVTVEKHTRNKSGRRPIPDHLPRVDVIHDLSEEEKRCPHDDHPLHRIGEEISEQLDIIPAKTQVLRHIRIKYGCRCCEQTVKTAALPPQPIPKSIASPGLLAYLVTAKFVDGLPLHRLEGILARSDIELSRGTQARWIIALLSLVMPLLNLMRDGVIEGEYLRIDETPVQVLKVPGKTATSSSYMWVMRNGGNAPPVILFEYAPSRAGAVPKKLLAGFHGYLQTDGYEAYNTVAAEYQLTHVGCFAHARRKFDEAIKAQTRRDNLADTALGFIRELYRIEREIQGQDPTHIFSQRCQRSMPVLRQFRAWLTDTIPKVPPKTQLGQALHYTHAQWEKLIAYCYDGILSIDNNRIENDIRPFVIGRNNWMFSDTVDGAQASAALYSLAITAKANGLNAYAYFRHIFTELPKASSLEHFEALLPWNVNEQTLADTS